MDAAFLKVQLSRFQAGKSLARDVYLEMPRNGKVLRLAGTGDELRAELLERLASRAVGFLLVTELSPGESGDTCELYLPPEGSERAESLPAQSKDEQPEGQRATGAPETQEEASILPEAEPPASSSISSTPSEQEERAFSPGTALAESLNPFEAGHELEASTRVPGVAGEREDEVKVKSWTPPEEQETIISGLQETMEDITRLAADEADRIGGDAASILKASLAESLTAFRSAGGSKPEEAIVAAGAAMEDCVNAFAQNAHTEQEASLASELRTAIESARERFAAAAVKLAKEESFIGRSETPFEKRFSAEQPLEDRTEIHRSGAEPLNTRAPELHRTKSEELSTELPETHREQPGSNSQSGQQTAFERENDDDNAASYSTNARAAVYRELPANAARLAALLAHSLGYASSQYLSDLSLAVIVYFSRKDGTVLTEQALPMLARSILDQPEQSSDPAIEDSLEIVRLLEAYFANPECDRTLRDFSRRVFRDTLVELRGRPNGVNPWNEARWAQVVDRGHSIEAQSLCGRASAAALKISKELQS